ncbi:MAG: hypothetical protein Kow0059_14930 [Candidatus Sumerlaeia bacterium]
MWFDRLSVFFLFLLLYVATMGGHLYSPDDEVMFRTTRALATRGRLDIEPIAQGFATAPGRDGRQFAQYGVGQPLLAVPFYWLGGLLEPAGGTVGAVLRAADPWLMVHHEGRAGDWARRLGVSLFNQFVGALLCAVFWGFVWELTRDRPAAWISTALLGAGSYVWAHSRPFFSEPLAALLILGSFYALHLGAVRRRTLWFALGGALFGGSLLVRLDSAFFGPGLAVFFLALLFTGAPGADGAVEPLEGSGADKSACANPFLSLDFPAVRPSDTLSFIGWLKGVVAATVPVLLGLACVFALNFYRFGALLTTGYEDQPEGLDFGTPLVAGLYGFLFSAGKGLFFFSPPLVLFFCAVGAFARRTRALAWGILAGACVFFLVQCKWRNFAGGWCWGPRHIFQLTPLLALPVGVWLSQVWRSASAGAVRVAVAVLLVVGAAVQLLGTSQNFISYYVEFYRTPEDGVYFAPLYGEGETQLLYPPPPAPINDSIYVPQHTQWRGNVLMLRLGRHDWFWLHLLNPPADALPSDEPGADGP